MQVRGCGEKTSSRVFRAQEFLGMAPGEGDLAASRRGVVPLPWDTVSGTVYVWKLETPSPRNFGSLEKRGDGRAGGRWGRGMGHLFISNHEY